MWLVILHIQERGNTDLLEVGSTGGLSGFIAGSSKNGKDQRGQNSDNGDDNEQFDERKSAFCLLNDYYLFLITHMIVGQSQSGISWQGPDALKIFRLSVTSMPYYNMLRLEYSLNRLRVF